MSGGTSRMNALVFGKVFARPWWHQILIIACAGFVFIQFSGVLGTRILAPLKGWETAGIGALGGDIQKADSLEGRFVRWDSGYYLQIAQDGYTSTGDERAFFPLYPLVCSLVSKILGLPLLWSGLLVSVSSYVAASILLYRWILIDYDPQVARWAVIWLYAFPMSFFFIAFYAEPLLLLTSVAGIYMARRGRFISSGIAIALAGATRPVAFLLAIPYVIEFWQQQSFDWHRLLRFAVGACIAPVGTIGYLVYRSILSGSSNLLSIHSPGTTQWQSFTITWPWITLFDGLAAALFGSGIYTDWFSRALVWQDLTYALLGLALAVWAWFRLRPSVAAFLLISVLFFYTNHGPLNYAFWSLPRHLAALFPIYLVLALLTVRLTGKYRWILLAVSVGLQGLLSAWFASGRWVS